MKSTLATFLFGSEKFLLAIYAGAIEDLSVDLSAMVNDSIKKHSTGKSYDSEDHQR